MQLPTQEDIRQEPFETKNVYLFIQKNSLEGIVSPDEYFFEGLNI
jgi:hypothetical protein